MSASTGATRKPMASILQRRFEPVTAFAVLGVVCLVYIIYVLTAWTNSPDFPR